jgi:hypothetical protein
MTEAEWLASEDPEEMLALVRGLVHGWFGRLLSYLLGGPPGPSKRKFSMFAQEMCERLEPFLGQGQDWRALQPGNPFHFVVWAARRAESTNTADKAALYLQLSLQECLGLLPAYGVPTEPFRAGLADVLRDIFGNPFREVTFDPAWRTAAVISKARAAEADQDPRRLPDLADELEQAGCDDFDILGHCRSPGPHVRGCWVVDAILGKS